MNSLRVLIYSSGLGDAYCTLTIASHLSNVCPNSSFLVLTDLPVFGRLRLPPNLDYVHIPGTFDGLREAASESQSDPIFFDWKPLIRRKITLATAKSFDPHLVIVEQFPLGLTNDMYDTLMHLRERHPGAKIVLGLWDIPGAADVIRATWKQARMYETFRSLYDEIWVYGTPKIFDPVQAYAIPADIAHKIVYTGYLRYRIERRDLHETLAADGINLEHPFVLVTTSGGKDGYRLVDDYLSFLESANTPEGTGGHIKFQSHIVCGPLMSSKDKNTLDARAERIPGVSIHGFHKDLSAYVNLARVVVSRGDYSACCQNLSFQKQAIIVPRQSSTADQLLRAQAFQQHGVVEMIHPEQLTPESLGQKVLGQMDQRRFPIRLENYSAFPLTGLDNIAQRVIDLCDMSEHRYAAA